MMGLYLIVVGAGLVASGAAALIGAYSAACGAAGEGLASDHRDQGSIAAMAGPAPGNVSGFSSRPERERNIG